MKLDYAHGFVFGIGSFAIGLGLSYKRYCFNPNGDNNIFMIIMGIIIILVVILYPRKSREKRCLKQ